MEASGMLTELHLTNFRCFSDHKVPLHPTTIIVGSNNAGKSTIVEALRLVSIVANRSRGLTYHPAPLWAGIPSVYRARGVRPSVTEGRLNMRAVFHRSGDPPATIRATFGTGEVVSVYIGPEGEVFGTVTDRAGMRINTKGEAQQLRIPPISILPQVAPLEMEERILTPGYVADRISSPLAPRHFRNQLNLLYGHFRAFQEMAESSWRGLQIRELVGHGALPREENKVWLVVRDGDHVAEVAEMGHGVQMWLQTVWFLTRCTADDVVILDEPDVYMHPDIQRRLVRMVRGRYRQTIIATHSVEIMAEVPPEEILVVDRRRSESSFAPSLPAVQRVIYGMGGMHNLQLARLWSSRRFILVEGKDLDLLRHLHNTLFPGSRVPLDTVPNRDTGGWGGWRLAVESSMVLQNAFGESITTYCIFDRDYYPESELDGRMDDARKQGVELHIWARKEIENYLIVPEAIRRVISARASEGVAPPSTEEVTMAIDRIAAGLRTDVTDDIAGKLHDRNKGASVRRVNEQARRQVERAWETWDGRISIIPGKALLSALQTWCHGRFSVSFGPSTLARELRPTEIPSEVVGVLTAIENGDPFRGMGDVD